MIRRWENGVLIDFMTEILSADCFFCWPFWLMDGGQGSLRSRHLCIF